MTIFNVATNPYTNCITIEVITEEADAPDIATAAVAYLRNHPDFPTHYIYDVETMSPYVTHFYADVEEAGK